MHCLLAPYWTQRFRELEKVEKLSNGKEGEFAIAANQASAREGILEVVWKEDSETVLIRGNVYIAGKGELILLASDN